MIRTRHVGQRTVFPKARPRTGWARPGGRLTGGGRRRVVALENEVVLDAPRAVALVLRAHDQLRFTPSATSLSSR